jgi:hypothetical protein
MGWKWLGGLLVLLGGAAANLPRIQAGDPDGATPPATSQAKPAASRLANAADVRKRFGLVPEYDAVPGIEAVKIAVLDYGFDGFDGVRPYLPASTVIVEHYDPEFVRRFGLGDPKFAKSFAPLNRHGRAMAQIVWAMTGGNPKGPQFYLLNANGPTMLRRAVRYAIEAKVDIILFSGSFEGGGNGDGRGPVNRIVADALAANILWINAAGNYGRRVYNGPIRIDPDGYLRFRDGFDGTTLRFRNRLDENTVTVTLTWNDYREQEDAGTEKDLDLYVEDWQGRTIAAGTQTQVSGAHVPGDNQSRNPRERVVLADLPANRDLNYRIRIRARGNNFTDEDRIRVLVTSARESYIDPQTGEAEEAVKFYDASDKGELYPPADNPLVLTVGDLSESSAKGPTADHRVKPDALVEDSRAFFTDGEVTAGSSNAAAYIAGVVAVLKAAEPGLQTRHLLRLALGLTTFSPTTSRAPAAKSPSADEGTEERLPGTLQPRMNRRLRTRGPEAPPRPTPPKDQTSSGREEAAGRRELRARDSGLNDPALPGARRPRIIQIDPLRPRLIIQGRRFALTADFAEGSFGLVRRPVQAPTREEIPPPTARASETSGTPPARNRIWQTPTRAELARLVQS